MTAQVLFRNTDLLCLCGSIPDLHNVILRNSPGTLSLLNQALLGQNFSMPT